MIRRPSMQYIYAEDGSKFVQDSRIESPFASSDKFSRPVLKQKFSPSALHPIEVFLSLFPSPSLPLLVFTQERMEFTWKMLVEKDISAQKKKAELRQNWDADYAAVVKRLERLEHAQGAEAARKKLVDVRTVVYMTDAEREEHRTCSRYVELLRERQASANRQKALSDLKVVLSTRL